MIPEKESSPHPTVFDRRESRTAAALFERLFPGSGGDPGATEIGVLSYVEQALAGAYGDKTEEYRRVLAALDEAALKGYGSGFADLSLEEQDGLILALERGELPGIESSRQEPLFEMLRAHLQEGLFADPLYGGNRDKLGWQFLGHPGVWLENSAEENLASEPVTKGGKVQSLEDLGHSLDAPLHEPDAPGYDPGLGLAPPTGAADIVLVGLGAVGGLVATIFAEAGLRVVALEAGPWRTSRDFLPDELGSAYYCRANMGPKFKDETPRWRRSEGEPTREATFSLGRMMNSVGGSVIHYGAWLRRYHPHHLAMLTHVRERWGAEALPEGSTLADWPLSYDELEPYYTRLEYLVGIAGDDGNSFIPRSRPYPMPPTRPFRQGELFSRATEKMGLHPYPVAVGVNTVPYNGLPETTYTAWSNGFGPFFDDKWHPGLTSVPEALATGNLELRTRCRVVRVLTGPDGRASGVEYVNAAGERYVQKARTVILCGYTFENVRLLLLSGDGRHPNGLGNGTGQVGKHFMTKMFAHVNGYFPEVVFNRHTGPAAQGIVLDDFLSSDAFDSYAHGFIGGATLGAENQALPIQISREALPPGVPSWGQGYKDHLKTWQHWGIVRIQPDALPYVSNFLDLDPRYRDKSGMPLVRITYDLRENERKLAGWMEGKAEEILREMGATSTWRGPSFTGVGSSHELGGCRMGEDPGVSVVDPELRVHDTPGLYVFGGAVCPTCPGINPTLTIWALCYRSAERLAKRLSRGEER